MLQFIDSNNQIVSGLLENGYSFSGSINDPIVINYLEKGNIILPASQATLDKITQDKINQEALSYLAETDWLVVRQMETGIAIPLDISLLRQAARIRVIR